MKGPSVATLVACWGVLLGLLGLTYAAYFVDLGMWNTLAAFTIALAKALLVLAIFMHLRYRTSLPRMVAGVGFLWLVFLLGLIMVDYAARHPDVFNFSN